MLFVLDQMNEVEKGENSQFSNGLKDFFINLQVPNLVVIFCASNNNEFSRKNILSNISTKPLM
jgi:hypothetical protein